MSSAPAAEAALCAPPPVVPTIWRLVSSKAKPIVVMNEGPVEHHVYCVHSVTGDVAGLDLFARRFGAMRLHGIQVPKQDMTSSFPSTIEAMAARHVDLLDAFQPDGPVHLIGWSAGAIVALEMAQQLRARGRRVPLLVALDGAPCNTGGELVRRDPRYVLKVVANLPRWLRDDRASDWSLAGIRKRLSEKIAARHGAPTFESVGTLDADAVARVVARPGWSPAQKAFVHMMYRGLATYVPRRYPGKVLVFETATQPLFHLRQVAAAWRVIADSLVVVRLRGNHSGLIREPTASVLAATVMRHLGEAAAGPEP